MRAAALSLVEVLAAIAIVGSAVTTMLVAQSRSIESLAGSGTSLEAQHIAKKLIADWRINQESVTSAGSGRVEGHENWAWKRSAQRVELGDGMAVMKVTLELLHEQPPFGLKPLRTYEWLVDDKDK